MTFYNNFTPAIFNTPAVTGGASMFQFQNPMMQMPNTRSDMLLNAAYNSYLGSFQALMNVPKMPLLPNMSIFNNNMLPGLSNFGFSSSSSISGDFASRLISNARKYIGHNESDGSFKKFTGGKNEAWCADFVSYVAKESGLSGFNFSSVQGILDWGRNNGKFHKDVKVGDVVIFKNNGKSHTGIVTSVENGKIKTIEGNTSNKVAERSYSLNDRSITGYVSLA